MFMVQCLDKPDSLALRMANRPAHLDHVKSKIAHVIIAGPFLAEDGETPIGSGFVVDFPDRAAAEAFFAEDPYNKAGLFQSIAIKPFKKVLP